MQWMWRLLFSALLCMPAIFMLVVGAWNEHPVASPEPRYSSAPQMYSSTDAALTISLPKTEAGPAMTSDAGESEFTLNVPAPVDPPLHSSPRGHSQHLKVNLWYAAAPKQESPTLLHWRLTTRPGVWAPGPNQDSGG